MVDTLANLVFRSWMHEQSSYSVQNAKDWEGPTKRAITAIIMQSDKATLKEA
jgi:hypothetical protein